jgi:hypothetical protein
MAQHLLSPLRRTPLTPGAMNVITIRCFSRISPLHENDSSLSSVLPDAMQSGRWSSTASAQCLHQQNPLLHAKHLHRRAGLLLICNAQSRRSSVASTLAASCKSIPRLVAFYTASSGSACFRYAMECDRDDLPSLQQNVAAWKRIAVYIVSSNSA